MDKVEAWQYVMKWAKNEIDFIPLTEKLAELGGYNYEDWRPLFTDLFTLGEDDNVLGSIERVENAMKACGISLTGPGPLSYPERSRRKTLRDSEDLPAPKRRKVSHTHAQHHLTDRLQVSEKGKRAKPVAAGDISCYLDLEALVSDEEDDDQEEEGTDSFIVPDGEDLDEPVAGPSSLPAGSRAYPVSGPSRFTEAVNAIFQRYSSVEDEQEPQEEEEDAHLEVLDIIGLWNVVGDWLSGALNFEHLMRLLDFQHGKYPKIGYWEDLVSELAYENDLDKREAKFKAITLVEHHRRLSVYYPASVPPSKIQLSAARSPSPPSVPSNPTASTSLWSVRIVPGESCVQYLYPSADQFYKADAAKFIAAAWNKVHLTASMIEGLHGRVNVQAPDPKTFLGHLPPSHIGCVRSYTLVPPEDRIPIFRSFGDVRAIPAWCLITRRGRYKGDLGYIISFNSQSGLFDILVASRELKPLPRHDNDDMVGEDAHARRLFFPQKYGGTQRAPVRGYNTYNFQRHRYVAGLMVMQLSDTQVRPYPNPSPHQIALHLESGINPSFMIDTRRRYNQVFWKPRDRVVINDANYFHVRAQLVSVDIENYSAVVETLIERERLFAPLSSLERVYEVGDPVRMIADPSSDLQNVHHSKIGKSGLIMEIDCETQEVTFIDDEHSPIRASPYLLESYQPDIPFVAPVSTTSEETRDDVQVGDAAEVVSGPLCGLVGTVDIICCQEVRIRPIDPKRPPVLVLVESAKYLPPANALKYSAEQGYNVRFGDAVVVSKVLEVKVSIQDRFFVPITHVAHEAPVQEHDRTQQYVGKEVLIIHGHYKGWRGTLRSVSRDGCEVAPGNAPSCVLKKNDVVARGCNSTLGGLVLSHAQLVAVAVAFRRGDTQDPATRQKTPPPDAPDVPPEELPSRSTDAWTVNLDDVWPIKPLTKLDFMLRPEVKAVLQTHHAIFKIEDTWRAGYLKRLCQTDIPDPFQAASGGPVPSSHLAVNLTARTAGGSTLHENIDEKYLIPYAPSKGGTYCMVTKTNEGGQGEAVGTILSVTTSSRKKQCVSVVRTDGSPATEGKLDWDRVIEVRVARHY
ncbi:hypothetical protein JVT61DRAFT_88 [Boletus reticuloceps]|uniref:Chromatin elongation factor spt5 n=1 Tax=Boletus reticuloceps TaxID=495285 RepID=A0A8I2YZ65_9AGAM|nr:hypothetical protein JVT61DRAFT_88 [Boletus reticuloceps]